ncbi:hypothetical protein QZM64_39930 [Burkholderia cepacia]|uniref:hypothetical protein n=1 Tax=Burkholderia cepacia complex TaxID=87882 RepID=UPI000D42AFD9|nr:MULTISPECIES: hypothetical protein [Burkholderia cepacia complex]MDN7445341.1 hypothetical protein [Burkholderia cepacia]PRD92215.1 hypothetical protein C6P88_16280 [Burkholderia contaminans]
MKNADSELPRPKPILEAPPTQAELDAQRRRGVKSWFFALGLLIATALYAVHFVITGEGVAGEPKFVTAMVFIIGMVYGVLSVSLRMPWSTTEDWSPLRRTDLEALRSTFAPDSLDAIAVEKYRQNVAALARPLVRRDLRLIASYRAALSKWESEQTAAQELATFNSPGCMQGESETTTR